VWPHCSRNIPILWRAVGGTTLTLQGPSGQRIGWSGRQAVWTVALHQRQRQSCSLKQQKTSILHYDCLLLVIKHNGYQSTVQTDNCRGIFYHFLKFLHSTVFYIRLISEIILSHVSVWLQARPGLMTQFIAYSDMVHDCNIQCTVTHALVSTVTSSLPLLCSCFQWHIFPILSTPDLSLTWDTNI
jgi:hypothetical protein